MPNAYAKEESLALPFFGKPSSGETTKLPPKPDTSPNVTILSTKDVPIEVQKELERFRKLRRAQYERLSPEAKQILKAQREEWKKQSATDCKKEEESKVRKDKETKK